ncbi:MAG: hypothetical protein B7X94_04000, partial [Hydrogenophilales bacterium 17-62-8]
MIQRWATVCIFLVFSSSSWAVSPYIQGDSLAGGSVQAVASAVEATLKSNGFKVVGKYFPKSLAGYGVVVATDDAMLNEVGSVGGFAVLGAAIRVGVKADGSVAYTNPDYWYRAYFRKAFDKKETEVKALQARLQNALGAGKGLGGDEPSGNLAHYRYMIGMERLDSSKSRLAEYGSFAEALKTVRDNLTRGVGKTAKVYEVVLPDRKLAVFGVAMHDGEHSDGDWIKKIDMQDHIAGLPYEIYVVNNEVGSPHGRFRIALAFPDVGMGQFMRISSL